MATALQKAFAHSRITKAAMRDVLADEGMTLKMRDAFLTEITEMLTASMTEPEIKELLYSHMIDYPADREEARRLLSLAETALTETQLQELQNRL